MRLAEQLARERAEARARAARDVNDLRGIDELDSLDQLEVIDWETDPWDDANEAGTVERLRSQTRTVKWVAYGALALVNLLIVIAGLVGWWYIGRLNPPGPATEPMSFTVEEGDTVDSLSHRLEAGGFITDAGVFRWYVARHGGFTPTPGYYELPQSDHMGNVLARLRTPPSQTYSKVTFPEGLTVAEMAIRLDNAIVPMSVAGFTTALADPNVVVSTIRPPDATTVEGLLFPDTYEVSNAENEAQVIVRMMNQMERVANQEDLVPGAERLGLTPYQVLIVASMIEEEAKTDTDRGKIARVIYNRLAIGMPLQIDAAVHYNTIQVGGDPALPFSEERQIAGPWNVYLNEGLPPTPITNPGRASIRAALNPTPNPGLGDPICVGLDPDDCQYLYYVLADTEGNHVFSATYDQFVVNVEAAAAAGLLEG